MNEITKMFVDAVLAPQGCTTAVVLDGSGNTFAEYTTSIAPQVAEDIGGYVMDKDTGEITYISEVRSANK